MKYTPLLLILMITAGCATNPKPSVATNANEAVFLYPVIDIRKVKKPNLLESFVQRPVVAEYMAEKYGCSLRYACDHGIKPTVLYSDFKHEKKEGLKALQSTGENYVLVIFLKEYHDTTSDNVAEFFTAAGFNIASAALGGGIYMVPGMTKDYLDVDVFLARKDTGQIVWTYSGPFRGGFAEFPVIVKKRSQRNELWKYYYPTSNM